MAAFARHGGLTKGSHIMEGINSRMDGIQAAILNVKLPLLESWTLKRKEIANKYIEFLDEISEIILPFERSDSSHVWHLFVIRTKRRDELKEYLEKNEVQTVIHYPIPPHKQKCYKKLNNLKFRITEKIHKEVLSLPISPNLAEKDMVTIVDLINKF